MRALGVGRWALGGIVVLAGCSSKPTNASSVSQKPKAQRPTPNASTINVGPGENHDLKPGAKSEPLWNIKFDEARVDPTTKQLVGQKLSGTVFQEGKPAADYLGDKGFADQTKQVLILNGNVQVKSRNPSSKVTLYCDELRYEGKTGKKGLIRAHGNVHVNGDLGTLTSASDLLATPDLSLIGTPDKFNSL